MNAYVTILGLDGRTIYVDQFYTSPAGTAPGPIRVPYGVRTFETRLADGTVDYRKTLTVAQKKLSTTLDPVPGTGGQP